MIEGYYLTCDDAECVDCFNAGGGIEQWEADGGFEGWDRPLSISRYDESDSPTHCVTCGVLLDHELTPDGYNYVGEAILECFRGGERNPVTQQWVDGFGEYLEDDNVEDLSVDTVLDLFGRLPLDKGEWATKYLAHITT